jgi:hypothetical protein
LCKAANTKATASPHGLARVVKVVVPMVKVLPKLLKESPLRKVVNLVLSKADIPAWEVVAVTQEWVAWAAAVEAWVAVWAVAKAVILPWLTAV